MKNYTLNGLSDLEKTLVIGTSCFVAALLIITVFFILTKGINSFELFSSL